jgi:hypothetical protein
MRRSDRDKWDNFNQHTRKTLLSLSPGTSNVTGWQNDCWKMFHPGDNVK